MNEKMEKWEKNEGIEFIRSLGIRKGDLVLDFGAGYGHYTLPAAEVVYPEGMVFAVDKRAEPLSKIAKKASDRGLIHYIKTIKNTGDVTLKFKSGSLDHVLLFDVLQSFDKDERNVLYREVYNILKPKQRLSVYLKHSLKGYSSGDFRDDEKDILIDEIEERGLTFDEEICGTLTHDVEMVEGCVLNFRKID